MKASESKGTNYYEIDGSKWNPKPTNYFVTKAEGKNKIVSLDCFSAQYPSSAEAAQKDTLSGMTERVASYPLAASNWPPPVYWARF